MDNGIYIALSRQMALFRDMAVTSNNIANANTTGYVSQHMVFDSYLVRDNNLGVRNPMAFANDISTYRNTQNGSMRHTGNPLDVAIRGNAYFTVETPLGTRYTRAGNFQVDGSGLLITPEGYAVLDATGQQIIFAEDDTDITIGEAGNLIVNGEERAFLGIVQFDNEQLLEPVGGSMYASDEIPSPAEHVQVAQGVLESSNVEAVKELVHMIDVSRSVASTAKFVEIMYDLQRKTSNAYAQQS